MLAVSYSSDVKKYRYHRILSPFFNDLKILEDSEGVSLNYGEDNFVLRATLISFVGDSLAVNDIYGFLSPAANRFCRMCLISRDEIKTKIKAFDIRTIENYKQQIQQLESGQIESKEVGIRERSALNCSKYFHFL